VNRLIRLVQLIGVNCVPLWAVQHEWSPATILALYWYESLLGGLLVAARMWLHRRLTRKRGHFMVESVRGRTKSYVHGSFLHHYLLLGLGFTAAHGIFLFALLAISVSKGYVQLSEGVAAATGAFVTTTSFLLFGFLADLPNLAERPFAWIRSMRNQMFGRTFLIHLTLIVGMLAVSFTNSVKGLLYVFVAFKLVMDLAGLLRWHDGSEEPPEWLTAAMRRQSEGAPLEDFEQFWIARWKVDSEAAQQAELEMPES
jgi:hypothetical protein